MDINKQEVKAMVRLLDDEDREVSSLVYDKLVSLERQILPELERILSEEDHDELVHGQVGGVISEIRMKGQVEAFTEWAQNRSHDLFEGVFLVAKYRYPELERQRLLNKVDELKLEAWLDFHNKLSSLEKIDILNHVFFEKHKFRGDHESYFSPANSYLNTVIERRRGIPITMSVLYSLVAQRLNLPVFGVNMPHHFILAYMDDSNQREKYYFQERNQLQDPGTGEVLFYINPFEQGSVFSKTSIDQYLAKTNLQPRPSYYHPCDNITIVARILRNLIFAYDRLQERLRMQELKAIYQALEPFQPSEKEDDR